jgi:hypothetical protein
VKVRDLTKEQSIRLADSRSEDELMGVRLPDGGAVLFFGGFFTGRFEVQLTALEVERLQKAVKDLYEVRGYDDRSVQIEELTVEYTNWGDPWDHGVRIEVEGQTFEFATVACREIMEFLETA